MAQMYRKFKKPIFCPNSACFGYNKTQVEMGDFIQVKTNPNSDALTLGRVVGEALWDGLGNKYSRKNRHLAVLVAGVELNHGYIIHVAVSAVRYIRKPGAFLKWFLFGEMPEIETLEKLVNYGAISNNYIQKYLDETGMRIVSLPLGNT